MVSISDVTVDDIKARVRELIADMMDDVEAGDIPDDLPLFDAEYAPDGLEIDSLDALKLVVALANEYDLDAAAEIDYSEVRTVREIAEFVHWLITSGGAPRLPSYGLH